MIWFENWRFRQENPSEWRYIYRYEQLRGLEAGTSLTIIDGGNTQLLGDPAFNIFVRNHHIELINVAT
jgi:hypothetical protein